MNAIKIRTRIDSETLHLRELKPLIGKQVEIIVLDAELGQPVKKRRFDFQKNFGHGWPGGKKDNFEKTVRRWRRQDKPSELPD